MYTGPHPFWQLERMPLETIDWPSHNSHRLDVTLNPDFMLCCDQQVVQHVLAADEAFFGCDFMTEASSSNVDGGDGKSVRSPAPFLLVHWMARHFGLLS
jgi:hypothetical protein